eukprot:TRINITY_DN23366_c0_g1_i1.p1 TRINITY_DN23366_c0_g1~~TRINITY_DN23366_c0_g1_i1.p1  ORF type:complete len:101 (-),score=7.22 TRINITY_DN23366_c0_g1_i1:22-324(-)
MVVGIYQNNSTSTPQTLTTVPHQGKPYKTHFPPHFGLYQKHVEESRDLHSNSEFLASPVRELDSEAASKDSLATSKAKFIESPHKAWLSCSTTSTSSFTS